MKPRKIVHLISSLLVGGLEQFAVRMAHFQRGLGDDARILTLHDGPLRHEAERLGVPITLLSGGKLRRVIEGATRFRSLTPDIIHAHNPTTLQYALLGKRATRAKVVLTLHGRGKNDSQAPAPALWKQTDALVAVSQFVADDWKQAGKPITVILNGVEFAPPQRTREAVRREIGLSSEALIGLVVARMDNLKGHETLLGALGRIPRESFERHALTVLLAGDGDQRAEREALAASLGLDRGGVRFLGFRNDVPDLLAAADFFVLPSYSEGLPLSVLEAMSHGLPVISTEVGGVPEVIRPNSQEGLLVPPRDETALADALTTLISDPLLRKNLGATGQERVRSEFSFERMICNYDALYSQLGMRG